MFTKHDLCERYGITLHDFAEWVCYHVFPWPVKFANGERRWREEDVEAFEAYIAARTDYEERGLDPDGPDGPAPPVYTTGREAFDPRATKARLPRVPSPTPADAQ